jgi:CRP-like cAMP-binding protein
MYTERIGLLQDMPVFGGVARETIALLLDRARVLTLEAGDYFFREGDPGGAVYVLERGRVAVLKGWRGHSERLRELGLGDCFGEMSLIDLGPRSASVLAIEACAALELTAADLRAVLQHDVSQYALVTLNMARELSRRMRDADSRLFAARMHGAADARGYAFLL